MLLKNRREIGAEAVIEIVLEFFCRIGEFSAITENKISLGKFLAIEIGLRVFCPGGAKGGESFWTENKFFEEATGEEKVGLRIFYPSWERGEKVSLDLEKFCPRE